MTFKVNHTDTFSPLLAQELKESAGLTDEEIKLYMSLLVSKTISKKDYEHLRKTYKKRAIEILKEIDELIEINRK